MDASELDSLFATPSRIERIGQAFAGRTVEARVLQVQHHGALNLGTTAGGLMVGTVEIVVPPTAKITEAARADGSGIQATSDFDPAPSGLWLWVPCDAVGECHVVFEELRQI
jgi:hypothetical protein